MVFISNITLFLLKGNEIPTAQRNQIHTCTQPQPDNTPLTLFPCPLHTFHLSYTHNLDCQHSSQIPVLM